MRGDFELYQSYLYHHGILGQKWGKKNGPPYPLDASDHSRSEQRSGWRRSLSKSSQLRGQKSHAGLTSGQKRAILIGAGVVVAGLAAYGAYKCGALDRFVINSGKEAINSSSNEWTHELQDMLNQQYSDLNNTAKDGKSASTVAKEATEAIKDVASKDGRSASTVAKEATKAIKDVGSKVPKFEEPRRINKNSGREAISISGDEWTHKLQDMLNQQYSDLANASIDGRSASAIAKEAAEAIKNATSKVPKFRKS